MKIPEFKVCAAALERAPGPPEWARSIDQEQLTQAHQRRRELPAAARRAVPQPR
jgi:hypothetical protein